MTLRQSSRCANLTTRENANLSASDLDNAEPRDADLTDAHLVETGLVDAELVNANLTSANLTDAKLFSANLMGAKRTRARCSPAALVTKPSRFWFRAEFALYCRPPQPRKCRLAWCNGRTEEEDGGASL